jgi:hypothetical protein
MRKGITRWPGGREVASSFSPIFLLLILSSRRSSDLTKEKEKDGERKIGAARRSALRASRSPKMVFASATPPAVLVIRNRARTRPSEVVQRIEAQARGGRGLSPARAAWPNGKPIAITIKITCTSTREGMESLRHSANSARSTHRKPAWKFRDFRCPMPDFRLLAAAAAGQRSSAPAPRSRNRRVSGGKLRHPGAG